MNVRLNETAYFDFLHVKDPISGEALPTVTFPGLFEKDFLVKEIGTELYSRLIEEGVLTEEPTT